MTNGAADTVIDLYDRHGRAWATLRNSGLVETRWLDRFCSQLVAGAAILDIGCGAGIPIAQDLVNRRFAVTGIDASATMLALFRRNLPNTPAHLMDMRRLALGLALGRQFAGLLAWDSFCHLSPEDPRTTFPRFQAHAQRGAAVMFTSGNSEGSAIGNVEGDRLYHGSLDPEEYRTLLDASGFDVVDHGVADPDCGHRTIWLARQRHRQARPIPIQNAPPA